jgi:hypothetical protein
MSDQVPEEGPAKFDGSNIITGLGNEPCPGMTVGEVAYKKFPGPGHPQLCGDPAFVFDDVRKFGGLVTGGIPGLRGTWTVDGRNYARGFQEAGTDGGTHANPRYFQASGDGVVDDTPAFTAAITGIVATWNLVPRPAQGMNLFVPPGVYNLTANPFPNCPIPFLIRSTGRGEVVLLKNFDGGPLFSWRVPVPTAISTNDFYYPCGAHDVTFRVPAGAPAQTVSGFLDIAAAGGSTKPLGGVEIYRCLFDGAFISVTLDDLVNAHIVDNVARPGARSREIVWRSTNFTGAGDHVIRGNNFDCKQMPGGTIIEIDAVAGIDIHDNKFNGNGVAGNGPNIQIDAVTALVIANIHDNSFENFDSNAIRLRPTGNVDEIQIHDNEFDSRQNANPAHIYISRVGAGVVHGVDIHHNKHKNEVPIAGVTALLIDNFATIQDITVDGERYGYANNNITNGIFAGPLIGLRRGINFFQNVTNPQIAPYSVTGSSGMGAGAVLADANGTDMAGAIFFQPGAGASVTDWTADVAFGIPIPAPNNIMICPTVNFFGAAVAGPVSCYLDTSANTGFTVHIRGTALPAAGCTVTWIVVGEQ